MSETRRALPSWMSKKAEKVKENQPLKSGRKRKAARSVFYCMNEKELVEEAVSCLTHYCAGEDVALLTDQKVEHKAEASTAKRRANPATERLTSEPAPEVLEEESSDGGDDQEATYVSETDLDITEVETVPYARSPQHPGSEGQRSGAVMKADVEHSQMQASAEEEDDAFRLVREIFFT